MHDPLIKKNKNKNKSKPLKLLCTDDKNEMTHL